MLEEIPDVSSLQCLIHASPAYRATYSRTRKTILHQLVARAYGLVGVEDAIAAVDSDNLHAEVEANKSAIIALLDRRRRHTDFRRSRLPSESQSIRLLQLYNKLSPVLAACRPPHVSRESWSGDSCLVQRGRVLRALCRLQTYSNIFGAREWTGTDGLGLNPEQGTTWHRHFTIDEMWSLFFRTMPPWEVEEFGSVWTFMRQMYTDFFASISKDFPRNSPEWRELRPATMPIDPSELYGSEDAGTFICDESTKPI